MKIQLALDRMTIAEAIAMAEQVRPYVDWIEIGTSLVKEFGMNAVSQLRAAFPEKILLADMKTFDNARYEFEMCFAAGADVATVMGAATAVTLETCQEVAARHGKQMMVDLLHTSEAHWKAMPIDKDVYYCAHVSKDQQEQDGAAQGLSATIVPSVLREANVPLAFAGGMTVEMARSLAPLQPAVLIVGTAITKAEEPALVAKQFADFARVSEV